MGQRSLLSRLSKLGLREGRFQPQAYSVVVGKKEADLRVRVFVSGFCFG
jgi:hypothetical protein